MKERKKHLIAEVSNIQLLFPLLRNRDYEIKIINNEQVKI